MSGLGNKEIMASNILRLMEENGKTRTQICNALGFKYSTFSEWVQGVKYPRIDKIEQMANYFGVQKSDLIEEYHPSTEGHMSAMFRENLKQMKKKSGLTTREIAIQSRVPEPTLEKLFSGTTQDPKLMTVWNVVHSLGYTLNDLDDDCTDKKAAPPISSEALQIAEDYDGLDDHGQRMVRMVTDEEKARIDAARPAAKKPPLTVAPSAEPAPESEEEPDYLKMPFAAHGTTPEEYTEEQISAVERFQREVMRRERLKKERDK